MSADASGLRAALAEYVAEVGQQAGDLLLEDVTGAAPVDTGELRDSGRVSGSGTGQGWTGEIAFDAPQAGFTDEGTRAHTIQGNPLLAFDVGGTRVIVHSVEHPGTRATNWFTTAVLRWGEKVDMAGGFVSVSAG